MKINEAKICLSKELSRAVFYQQCTIRGLEYHKNYCWLHPVHQMDDRE